MLADRALFARKAGQAFANTVNDPSASRGEAGGIYLDDHSYR
jgi:hypothetical protein